MSMWHDFILHSNQNDTSIQAFPQIMRKNKYEIHKESFLGYNYP